MTTREFPLPDLLSQPAVRRILELALQEDIGSGDATTLALVPPDVIATGVIEAREACCVAGTTVAQAVLSRLDAAVSCAVLISDGEMAEAGAAIMRLRGPASAILTGERTALNFMQRMCGIATLTSRFVAAVAGYGTLILDTRKTTPGLRPFEKYSVLCGGGHNHRFGLYDRILMKDNHRRLWAGGDPERLDLAVLAARQRFPKLEIEIEVESVAELESALRGAPEWVLLDNMDCATMAECVRLARGISRTEASGGITLERAAEVAATGVDAISLGCLTHSATAIDLALEWSVV